jgi:hypothetical protein
LDLSQDLPDSFAGCYARIVRAEDTALLGSNRSADAVRLTADVRLQHAPDNQVIQRFRYVGDIAAPDALRRPVDLKAIPLEDGLQPVQGEIVSKLARHDVRQQARSGQRMFDAGGD